MSPQPDTQELRRELQATLSARRELGPEYDDQFIERLVEKLTAQVRREVAQAPRPRVPALSSEQRTAIALFSFIFGIPLVAIAGGEVGSIGLIVAFLALVLINLAAGRTW